MEKNAVVLSSELDKIASMRGRPCPKCGSGRVDYTGLTPNCSNCGSEPWEPNQGQEGKKYGTPQARR